MEGIEVGGGSDVGPGRGVFIGVLRDTIKGDGGEITVPPEP